MCSLETADFENAGVSGLRTKELHITPVTGSSHPPTHMSLEPKLAAHELLWVPKSIPGFLELRTTRGLVIGSVIEMGGSWQCVCLGSVIAVRPDEESAREAVSGFLRELGRLEIENAKGAN